MLHAPASQIKGALDEAAVEQPDEGIAQKVVRLSGIAETVDVLRILGQEGISLERGLALERGDPVQGLHIFGKACGYQRRRLVRGEKPGLSAGNDGRGNRGLVPAPPGFRGPLPSQHQAHAVAFHVFSP